MGKSRKFFLFIMMFAQAVSLFHCGKEEKKILKEAYTLEEVLEEVAKNYGGVQTLEMRFSDRVQMVYSKTNSDVLEIKKGRIVHVLDGGLKAATPDVELVVDKQMGIIGRYEGKQQLFDFNHMAQWIGVVYKMVLLLPMQFKEIARYKTVTLEKTKTPGSYILKFPEGEDGISIHALVNMGSGAVEKIGLKQKGIIRDTEQNLTYAPYEINARLAGFKRSGSVLFPRRLSVQYRGKEGNFLFESAVQKAEVNVKIAADDLALSASGKKTASYRDPVWIDQTGLALLRTEAEVIKNEYDEYEFVNKNYSIVKKDIESGREEMLKHIYFSPEKSFTTRFVFTADYNRKNNKLAYAVTEKVWNENKEISAITGVYIMDLAGKKTVKVSDRGYMPLWSASGELLIWGQAVEGKRYNEINDVWSCDKEGQEKRMLIHNAFHYSWGLDDRFIVVERGFWAFSRGYINPTEKNVEQGVYLFDLKTGSIRPLASPGYNPHVSANKKRIVYSDTEERSGVYLYNLETDSKSTLVKLARSYDIIDPYWGRGDQFVIYIFASCDTDKSMKCGLYKYSFNDNSNKLLTEEIRYTGAYTYFLDYSRDGKYLLYRFYQEPDWYSHTWGVYHTLQDKVFLKY